MAGAKLPKVNSEVSKKSFIALVKNVQNQGFGLIFARKHNEARIPLSRSETFHPCRTCGSVRWKLVMAA